MDSFVQTLVALRNAPPDRMISVLYRIYSTIALMGDWEVVPAFQTVKTVAEEMDLMSDPMIRKLLNAMRIRMITITSERRYRVMSTPEWPLDSWPPKFYAVVGRDLDIPF